jgi:hypothetical protein
VLMAMHSDCTITRICIAVLFSWLSVVMLFVFGCAGAGVDGRFRDKPEIFANQARQCAVLSTSSAMLYDAPGQEDEDSALRFKKITKDEYADVKRITEAMWTRKENTTV